MTAIRPGRTCLLSSMSNVLLGRDANVDEELIFLLGRGNRIDYRLSDVGGQPEVFLGHHSLEVVARFCALFHVEHTFIEGRAPDPLCEVRAALESGNPVLIWVEMALLPYLQMKPPAGAIHAVTVSAERNGVLAIDDCYVPLSLYSDKVTTHTMQVPFEQFHAWRESGYCRHALNFNQLVRNIDRPRIELVTQGVRWACDDFLHGAQDAPAAADVLHCLAHDLAWMYERYPGSTHPQLYSALAYNLRYFGTLWTRELMASAINELAVGTGLPSLPGLAQDLRESVRRWKLVILGLLKLPLIRRPQQIDSLQRKIEEILILEREIYRALALALRVPDIGGSIFGNT